MALPAGATLGPYRIIEQLGKGGMAYVYRAYEAGLDRDVALKVLPGEFLHDETFAERFRREAKVIAKLEHPNILPIHAFGIEEGVPWMAMRLVSGGTLSARLKGGRLAPAEVLAVLRNVALALDHAHRLGVIHRDVKPQNVLLDDAHRVYLADFGIAKMVEGSSTLTATGMISGTPHYMAPEQALGRTVDHRADIYALGIMAYQMLLGHVPFDADTPVAVLLKHAQEPMPLPSPADVPEPVARALMKCVAKNPPDRWPSCLAFVQALEAAFAGVRAALAATGTVSALPAEAAPPTLVVADVARAPAPRSRAALAAGIGLALVAAVAAGYLGLRRRPGPSAPLATEAVSRPLELTPGVEPARLALDFEHSLSSGTLKIWLDDALVVDQRLDGRVSKDLIAFKLRKGAVGQTLEVPPGRHTVRVEVSWGDTTKSEILTGAFAAGRTRRLEARLGRIRKNLSLDWR